MQLSILSVAVLAVAATVHASRRTADEYWSDEEPDYTPDQIIARLGGEDKFEEGHSRAQSALFALPPSVCSHPAAARA